MSISINKRKIIVGTRGSLLATRQTQWVVEKLHRLLPEIDFSIKIIKTRGDKILHLPLPQIGDKGVFVKDIEEQLLQESIDIAVHSAKDLPLEIPEKLHIAAIPQRANPLDALISREKLTLKKLPQGANIGTSSLRRKVQILKIRPDLNIVEIRGNLDTRIKKLERGDCHGIILACAGLERMGWENLIVEEISPEICLPAVGQGALAIETRKDDQFVNHIVSQLNHQETQICVIAERSFLYELGGGCQIPIGALTKVFNKELIIQGFISDLKGIKIIKEEERGEIDFAEKLGKVLAKKILSRGGDIILREIKGDEKQ